MNEFLRDRINRKLDTLPEERAYQILDYIEFLESKYAERTNTSPSVFQRFAEGVEDTMRAGRISATTIGETMGLLNKAMNVLNGAAAAGKSVASDVVNAVSRPPSRPPASGTVPADNLPPTIESAPPSPPPPSPQAPQGDTAA